LSLAPAIRAAVTLGLSVLVGCRPGPKPVDRILLVTIDTLRWDRLGYAGSDVETPNLDRLARSGAIFTDAVAAAPITLPSHASILSGLYPPSHGARFNGIFRVPDGVETIAETFNEAGFATGAFVGAFVLERRFGLEQGFDHYDDELPDENPVHPVYFAERRAEEVVSRALSWIEAHKQDRFFVWVHVYDPHAPHNAPPPYAERYPGRGYEAEVAYTDAALGPLLESVNDERSAILVVADHGEGLGDHGESTHTLFVYDSTMKVPLVLKAPGVAPGTRVEKQVRSVDIAPTVLELAGLRPKSELDGISLLRRLQSGDGGDLSAYGESYGPLYQFNWAELRFARREGFKYIDAPRPELYDLRTDPKEMTNLWSDHPPEIGRRLREELEKASKSEKPASTVEVDKETARRLESLGYLASTSNRTASQRPDPKDRVEIFERMQVLLSPDLSLDQQLEGYREILLLEPENILAQKRLSAGLAQKGKLEEAVEEYRRLQRISEFDTKDWENLVSALLLLNRTEEALALVEQAVADAPWYRELQVLKGEALEKAGRLEEALAAYRRAIELRPEDPENHWRHGMVALKMGDNAGAERDFRECLARDASFREGRLALARLLSQGGRAAEALELLGGMDAETVGVKVAIAEAHLASGRYDLARPLLEDAVKLEPENTRALALLGPVYGRAGELPAAAQSLEKAIALGETSSEIRRNLALVYLQQGRTQAAIAQLRKASEDAPDDGSNWFALGNALLRGRDGNRAAEAFERALALRPDWPEAIFNLALAYQGAGKREKASEAYRRFLAGEGSKDPQRRAEAEKRLLSLERQGR
jgi:arylsulfatase A-like enzyme/tetratricopeptide (TPR) repeat protein